MTEYGRLDVRGAIGDDLDYDQLVPHSVVIPLELGLTIRAIDLPTLIRLKEQAGRDKDLAVLPHLRRTLAERRKRGLEK